MVEIIDAAFGDNGMEGQIGIFAGEAVYALIKVGKADAENFGMGRKESVIVSSAVSKPEALPIDGEERSKGDIAKYLFRKGWLLNAESVDGKVVRKGQGEHSIPLDAGRADKFSALFQGLGQGLCVHFRAEGEVEKEAVELTEFAEGVFGDLKIFGGIFQECSEFFELFSQ